MIYGVYENKALVHWPPSKIFGDEIKVRHFDLRLIPPKSRILSVRSSGHSRRPTVSPVPSLISMVVRLMSRAWCVIPHFLIPTVDLDIYAGHGRVQIGGLPKGTRQDELEAVPQDCHQAMIGLVGYTSLEALRYTVRCLHVKALLTPESNKYP